MLKRYVLVLVAFSALGLALSLTIEDAGANTSGAPTAKTGSPGDGSNCTSCHSGTAVTVPGLITSDIPPTGYMPGNTYTITASITGNTNKYGFQISPQSTTGVLKGTLIVTNGTQTQVIGSGKWITHRTAGTSGTGGKTWTFNWTAPAINQGPVTFYGAFNIANGNGASSGDLIRLSTLTVQQDASAGIMDESITEIKVDLFPNPVQEQMTLRFNLIENGAVIRIMDVNGRIVKSVDAGDMVAGENTTTINVSDLEKGIYFAVLESGGMTTSRKFMRL